MSDETTAPNAAGATASDPAPPARPAGPPTGRREEGYRVLARKYRPGTFAELIGQGALVRTLSNAIAGNRLAHAFILTGVRGVGKTTTARILAKAVNCLGADGTNAGPTADPCGVCDACRAIAADRHVDVMEMDAASRTGVDDIREIIDGVRYGPVSARFKVYIIDEVHMLSRNAFNALLKTLEEPPPHVKFIFATTEIRKVPVTVLSRCQRFDLPRVEMAELVRHFTDLCRRESVSAESDAIGLIARAADGSVRDGLSLLDQAIVLGGGAVTAEHVAGMLGLADRSRILDLFALLMKGEAAAALERLSDLHRNGADPLVVLRDLLDITHFLTRAKLNPALAEAAGLPEEERTRGLELAGSLSMPVLTRAWQMLLKGVQEVQGAPTPEAALEMVLIRLMHAAPLPPPGEIIRRIEDGRYGPAPASGGAGGGGPAGAAPAGGGVGGRAAPFSVVAGGGGAAVAAASPVQSQVAPPWQAEAPPETKPMPAPEPDAVPAVAMPDAVPGDWRAFVALFSRDPAQAVLHGHLYASVQPVSLETGRVELHPLPGAPSDLAAQVMQALQRWTGRRWMVTLTQSPGGPTLSEQDRAADDLQRQAAADHPVVKAALAAFPGARIAAVHDLTKAVADSALDAALPLSAEDRREAAGGIEDDGDDLASYDHGYDDGEAADGIFHPDDLGEL